MCRHGGRVWGHVAGEGVGCQAYGMDGNMCQEWGRVRIWGMWHGVGSQAYDMDGDMWWGGGIWQGMGEYGRGGGRVWGHVAGVGVCGRDQAYGMDGNMWWGGGMW